ncbi:hypothetical protein LSH36_1194g00005 [Paralvinella palmiformis]|uniref:Uncharacterized protein n=1 Tax=Paralvinella palmiformis TaxID=53620 RepID=A0AAD9IU18_9ANNE|nr:hypothetical protein LSH36_1194g00005 [Paralvinella palmiformis]
MDKSPSESLRLRGKKLVEEADAVGDSVELLKAHTLYLEQESVDSCPIRDRDRAYLEKIKLLREAVRFFKKAAAPEAKPKPGEAASAHKNMAIVLGELAVLNNNEGDISQSADIIYHWNKAMVYGLKDGFPENWHSGVRENLLKSAKKLVQLCRSAGVPAGIRRLENTLREVTDRELRYMILSVICELYIAGSLDDLNKRHYEIALDYMEECLIHFKEVETLVSNEEEKRFMVNMKRRIMDIKAEATAMQIIAKADKLLLEIQLLDNSDDKTNWLYFIIDFYTEAAQISENAELDSAAEAYNRIASLYKSMLNDEDRARFYYHESARMAAESRKKMDGIGSN